MSPIACVVGICLILVIAGCDRPVSPSPSGTTVAPKAEEHSTVAALNDAMGPEKAKNFYGAGDIGSSLASINAPSSDEEKRFLAEFSCLDEAECYGSKKFQKYILSKYPDIKLVKYKVPSEIESEDKETREDYKRAFIRSLYFAKQIKLANGLTLFDFLGKCGKQMSPLNAADVALDPTSKKLATHLQYFAVFRSSNGEEIEAQILLNRIGEKIEATSPLFSSAVLRDPDFMKKHGFSCWVK